MPISYDLDLNLPTDPGLPPGEEYDEFRRIYNALRQLQESISENAGLVSIDPENLSGSGVMELYALSLQSIMVFNASSAITIGSPVMFNFAEGLGRIKQPVVQHIDPEIFDISVTHVLGFPLFNCSAGETVAIVGTGGVAPFPGAALGYGYALNSSYVPQAYNSVNPPLVHTPEFEGDGAVVITVGLCLEANKLLVRINGLLIYG